MATSMSLITLITTIGDIIALYLLPQSGFYREVIYGMQDGDIVGNELEELEGNCLALRDYFISLVFPNLVCVCISIRRLSHPK